MQNMLGLNKSQQYLYQQTSQNMIILEGNFVGLQADEREDYSESNTNISKFKKLQNMSKSKIIDEDDDFEE